MALPLPPGIPASNLAIFLNVPNSSPPSYALIANLGDFAGPTQQATVVDVSKHGDKFRQKITTLLDSGTVAAPCWFDPSVSTLAGNSDALAELFQSRELQNWLIAFVIDGTSIPDANNLVCSFNAYVSKFSFKEPVAGVWSADTEFLITGGVTYLWPSTTPPTGHVPA